MLHGTFYHVIISNLLTLRSGAFVQVMFRIVVPYVAAPEGGMKATAFTLTSLSKPLLTPPVHALREHK
jgi:hypothetical protein